MDALPDELAVSVVTIGELRDSGRRMPVNDSWIAATAIAHDIALVTQDHDYVDVPGLVVITV